MMNYSNKSRGLLRLCVKRFWILKKNKSSSMRQSGDIRSEFVKYFINEHNHHFVKSSSVVPFSDPTVPFVNAGMNQFKGIFLGKLSPVHKRVVNSQKCIRVSGKHNDLNAVGMDGTHHTFFEMLGNWSFGDYYKEEACKMAWNLLTGSFNFSKQSLVITYFGGDEREGLEPDLETRDIWLRIGVPADKIIPCSMKDNFWEMGVVGPCGPCTEIHFSGTEGNLIEIWNIVFIQYQRQSDGTITSLPNRHVDTGMGLERITSIMQNKKSNYDTDLFVPLMETIHKHSKDVPKYGGLFTGQNDIDYAYRVLADHARMISICLADEVYPCSNLRLKNALRRAISIGKNTFKSPNIMLMLYNEVTKSLGGIYPELYNKMDPSKEIIMQEEHSLVTLQNAMAKERKYLTEKYPEISNLSSELHPGFVEGYKQFKDSMKSFKDKTIPGELAFKLYDTFGLDEDMINQIADINNLSVDKFTFKRLLDDHKARHKAVFTKAANVNISDVLNKSIDKLCTNGLPPTDDSFKYIYRADDKNEYKFEPLKSELVAVLNENGERLPGFSSDSTAQYYLVFKESNFYCEEGGQSHDTGEVAFDDILFKVEKVSKHRDFILHHGKVEPTNRKPRDIKLTDIGEMNVDGGNRLASLQHHTATHLLNASIRKLLPDSVTCQLGSKVTPTGLSLTLGVYGKKLNYDIVDDVEKLIRNICSVDMPVTTDIIDSQQLPNLKNVTVIPGEVYPENGLRLVNIGLIDDENVFSRELCCGTHVFSTKHLENFTITSIRGLGSHMPTIRAVTGKIATQINSIRDKAQSLKVELDENIEVNNERLNEKMADLRNDLEKLCKGEGAPFGLRQECLEIFKSIEKRLKEINTNAVRELIQKEIATALEESVSHNRNFVVHFLACSYLLEPGTLSLDSVISNDVQKPLFVLGCANGILKATCYVPHSYVTKNFNAEKWMSTILPVFDTTLSTAVKKQDLNTVAHMKGKKVSLINCEQLVADAMKVSIEFATDHLQKMPHNVDEERNVNS